jgi:hypothetical protein
MTIELPAMEQVIPNSPNALKECLGDSIRIRGNLAPLDEAVSNELLLRRLAGA